MPSSWDTYCVLTARNIEAQKCQMNVVFQETEPTISNVLVQESFSWSWSLGTCLNSKDKG